MANEDSESRTSSVGRHVSAPAFAPAPAETSSTSSASLPSSASSPHSTSGKKRRRRKRPFSELTDIVPMGASTSKSTEPLQPSTSLSANSGNPSIPTHHASHGDDGNPSIPNLGNNRLATGFKPPPLPKTTRAHSDSSQANSPGDSKDDAIEISSDEEMDHTEDSEGGMIVNVNDSVPGLTTASTSEDDGMVTSSDDGDVLEMREDVSGRVDPTHLAGFTSSNIRLVDLDPDSLEEQFKYALYHLDRTQIDLNRLVTCLGCMKTGHLSSTCPAVKCKHCNDPHATDLCPIYQRCKTCRKEGHSAENCSFETRVTTVPCDACKSLSHVEQQCPERHFAPTNVRGPVKLWISCCICASRSHMAGDCPDAPTHTSAVRWSLKALDPGSITNLSLESSTRKLENEAETRGMRPAGLSIKGRASQHQTGFSRSTQVSDDDEQGEFLRPSVNRSNPFGRPQIRLGDYQIRRPDTQKRPSSDRYDRFDAPSVDGGSRSRGRGPWYNTDSFGRRRSRSPRIDTYRPASRRSPSPRRFDGYAQPDRFNRGSPPSDYWRPGLSHRPLQPSGQGNPGVGLPSSSPMRLPSRRGSNPNLPMKPPTSMPKKSVGQTSASVTSTRKKQQNNSRGETKNKKKGAAAVKADCQIPVLDDDFSALGNLTTNDFNFSEDGAICLDLPDNLQAWLDRINGKRKRKGQKPFFVSDHGDVAQPKRLTLFDAEIGKKVHIRGLECTRIVAKGYRLLGNTEESKIALQRQERDADETEQEQTQANEQRPRYMLRSQQALTGPAQPGEPRYALRSRVALGTVSGDRDGHLGELEKAALATSQSATSEHRRNVVALTRNEVQRQVGRREGSELSAWLALENSLRKAQGKGPILIQRAPAATVDTVGMPIHSYLTDPATGASRSLSSDRYHEMRHIGRLLQAQGKQGSIKGTHHVRVLKAKLLQMRGQALPQPAPMEFAEAIRHGLRSAAAEGRQVVLSNLSLDATAVDIESFFSGYDIESISIAYDRITEMPTGLAQVDLKTSEHAEDATRKLSGKRLLDKSITFELRSNQKASGP